jgi:ATP-dependent helicase Lhr and Lhr-like helicase
MSDSRSFSLLHQDVQRWVWQEGWTELRDAQEEAIEAILNPSAPDVIISAATASGKTEAAFLPIASRLLFGKRKACVLYISPLKALINDQLERHQRFFGSLDLPVVGWHGDISESQKSRFRRDPRGALLTTPESLEGMFVNHGQHIAAWFQNLEFVVVDELHCFLDSERGVQVMSLLNRLELRVGKSIPRIGLSATLGDMQLAAELLRPGQGKSPESKRVKLITSKAEGQGLKILLKAVKEAPAQPVKVIDELRNQEEEELAMTRIATELFEKLRGEKNLIFANTRREVEQIADLMSVLSESERVPNEFFPHHGSLSREMRELAEARLKDISAPATAIATSTLEMGIDIGAVKTVAQVVPPYHVGSLRQRLGRSGRRGEPAILRAFVKAKIDEISLEGLLHYPLVQTIAVIQLLLERWTEPPRARGLHLSTLTHQLMSIIAERGGVFAKPAYQILCQTGPFRTITPDLFGLLLRALGESGIISQASDGLLVHGPVGEKVSNHYSFLAVFQTPTEFRVMEGSKFLGTLPLESMLMPGDLIIFGGRRWEVVQVLQSTRILEVKKARGGKAISFPGEMMTVHHRIRQKMFEIYKGTEVPPFLDPVAAQILEKAREVFVDRELDLQPFAREPDGLTMFHWTGDREALTIKLFLLREGVRAEVEGPSLVVAEGEVKKMRAAISRAVCNPPIPGVLLAEEVKLLQYEKFDNYLNEDLLRQQFAAERLDVEGAWAAMNQIADRF